MQWTKAVRSKKLGFWSYWLDLEKLEMGGKELLVELHFYSEFPTIFEGFCCWFFSTRAFSSTRADPLSTTPFWQKVIKTSLHYSRLKDSLFRLKCKLKLKTKFMRTLKKKNNSQKGKNNSVRSIRFDVNDMCILPLSP